MTPPARPKLQFRQNKRQHTPQPMGEPWQILVVDDDPQVHTMTDLLLHEYQFDGCGFTAIHAYSAAEAKQCLIDHPQIPVALIDVVMERPAAGLELVRTIRDEMDNPAIRIILRTGQPGEAPERSVVLDYDINDYKAKTELTSQKLFTTLVGALRSWRDIMHAARMADELAEANTNLERRVQERTRELTQALEEVSIAKRDLRQFLSMMSHEFRTPLAIIDSAAQMLLLRSDPAKDANHSRLEAIRGGVDRLIGLIETCLADDRLEAESLNLRAEPSDITPLIQSAVDEQKLVHHDREIILTLPPLPNLLIDNDLMTMAFNNLLNNALKYSSKDIRVTVSPEPGHVRIDIADQGVGVPSEDLEHIFERFYRSENVKGLAGTGIGLHMSHRIVTMHGGSLTVDSTENVGSTFTIRLPLPTPAATA